LLTVLDEPDTSNVQRRFSTSQSMGESNYSFRRRLYAAALLFLMTSACQLAAQTRSFDVEAGSARTTLREFARQARVSVVMDRQNVEGVQTNEVSGLLIPKYALERMLEGTPLVFKEDLETGAFAVTQSTVSVAEETTRDSEVHAPEPKRTPQQPRSMNENKRTIGSLFKGLLSLALASSPSLSAQDDDTEEVFELSPFSVDSRTDDGYNATETMAGTRLRTSTREIGASMTIMTAEFLEDLGVTSFEEALEYAPNTSDFDAGLIDAPNGTNTRMNGGNRYSVRGFQTASLSRDFFETTYKADMYNTERITFSRGPNSILFGIGSPGGVTNSTSKRARFGDVREISFRTDDNGSFRASFDFNKELIEDKLAIRVAGLDSDQRTWQHPSYTNDERLYMAIKLKPFANSDNWLSDLEINANHEMGELDGVKAPRQEPVFDSVTPWIAAGRPMYDGVPPANPNNAGIYGIQMYIGRPSPIISHFSPVPGASAMPPISGKRTAMGMNLFNFDPSLGDNSNNRSLMDQSILPHHVNFYGFANSWEAEVEATQVIVNKEIAENLHFEFAYNVQHNDRVEREEIRAWGRLRPDVNTYLPNGDPNPMAGQIYMDSPQSISVPWHNRRQQTERYALSYEFDFADQTDGWAKHLGKIRAAGSFERRQSGQLQALGTTRNMTPLKFNELNGLTGADAFKANISHGWNQARMRFYLDPEHNVIPVVGGNLPYYFFEDEIPQDQHDQYGLTMGTPIFLGARNEAHLDSKVVTVQNLLFNDRLITTWGWRDDAQDLFDGSPLMPRSGPHQLKPDPRGINPYDGLLSTGQGTPQTFGVMGYPLPWLGLFYNESENFVPAGRQFDIFGERFPNRTGEGEDVGIKLFLFDNKLIASLTKYETTQNNTSSGFVRAGMASSVGRDFGNSNKAIWSQVATLTENDKYMESPYWFSVNNLFGGYLDSKSEGYEYQVTYNPTREWRIMFNYSEQEGVLNNVASRIHEYWHEWAPGEWDTSWNDVALETDLGHPGGRQSTTLGELYDNIRIDADRMLGLNGTSDTRQPLESMNLVANYTFPDESPLKGLSLGGTLRKRGDRFLGFPDDANGVPDASGAFKGGKTEVYDAMARYRMKIFNDIDWSLQLNIRNILDDTSMKASSTDGIGEGNIVRWRFQVPRTYQLTSTFRF
jgi:iron complex outermembrane recepter protein